MKKRFYAKWVLSSVVAAFCGIFLCFNFCFGGFGVNLFSPAFSVRSVSAEMPFYALNPQKICLRAEFYTSYVTSSDERKHNVKTAANALNNVLVDVGGEFSFNYTVGARTESRGYKKAKIIVDGKFVDGVGGGVCQVSSTLYNAVLLAGLKVTEFHPHSLPVSYVAPSFDAMVNSGSADLKFVNNTHNPIIIKSVTDDSQIKISIFGEPLKEKYVRQSRIIEEIPACFGDPIKDVNGNFPDLFEGETKILSYGRKGYKSEGLLLKLVNGKLVSSKLIRTDKYNCVKGVIVEGTQKKSPDAAIISDEIQ